MRKIAKESIFQLLPRNARFYLTANLKHEASLHALRLLRNLAIACKSLIKSLAEFKMRSKSDETCLNSLKSRQIAKVSCR